MCSGSRLEIRAARPSDLARLAHQARRPLSRLHGYGFSLQLGGEAFVLELEGEPIAAAGFWPAEDYREAWFMVTPALCRKSVMPAAIALVAAELGRLWRADMPTIATVKAENRGGHAVARRLGFIDAGDHPEHPGSRLYVLTPP